MNIITAKGSVWKVFITSEEVRNDILNLKVSDGSGRQVGVVIWYGDSTGPKKHQMCLNRKYLSLMKLGAIFYNNKEQYEIV